MSRLTAVAALALALCTRSARADDAAATWTFDARAGYAAAYTTGQSAMGPGTGLAYGTTLPNRFHVDGGVMLYAGSVQAGVGPGIVYRSRIWSSSAYATVGYDVVPYAPLVIRPQVVGGALVLAGATQVNARTMHDLTPLVMLGPGLSILGRAHGCHAGIALEALFVPSRVAAPIAAAYAVFGIER